jgi:putative oxidoreductase
VIIGMLLLRVTVGVILAAHGTQKLFGWFGGGGLEGTGKGFEGLGFHPGRRAALMAGLAETGGGLLLALGLFTPLAAAIIIGVMLVAVGSIHFKNGFFNTGGGWEYNLVIVAAVLGVAFTGPGPLSLDAVLGYQLHGLRWGVAALAMGVLAGVIQLAGRHALQPAHPTS